VIDRYEEVASELKPMMLRPFCKEGLFLRLFAGQLIGFIEHRLPFGWRRRRLTLHIEGRLCLSGFRIRRPVRY
jgi:hypothetical protein